MARADIIVYDLHRDKVISALHDEGIVELRDVRRDNMDGKELLDRSEAPPVLEKLEEMQARLSRCALIVGRGGPPYPGGIASMFSKKPDERVKVNPMNFEEKFTSATKLLDAIEAPLLEAEEEFEKIGQEIEVLNSRHHAVTMVKDLGIDLSLIRKSQFTFVIVGTTPDPVKLKEIISPFTAIMDAVQIDKAQHVAIVSGLRKEEKEIVPLLRNAGFYPIDVGNSSGRASEELYRIDKAVNAKESAREDVRKRISKVWKEYHKSILTVREEIDIEIEKSSAVQKLGRTSSTHTISTWCPSSKVKRLEEIVGQASEGTGAVYIGDPGEETPPSEMKNPRWSGPFQSLTEMFGTPGYMEIDPTKIIAPVFVLFFGLMLGDALYGAIMTIFALMLYRGTKKHGDTMRQFSIILICAGLSTVFFGIIQGGYFGPVIETQPNLVMLLGFTPPVWLDAMKDPIFLLVISLIVGLIYLNTGLALAGIQNAKRKDPKSFFTQQVPWWLLQPAAFVLLGGGLFGWWTFSSTVQLVAWVFTLLGMLLLFIDKKGLFFFEITGFIGNFLSFARLLALGLATAGIALTINVIISLIASVNLDLGALSPLPLIAGIGVIGFGMYKKNKIFMLVGGLASLFGVLAMADMTSVFVIMVSAVMYIAAHIINLALQALGAFVHALRLQYVEFFGLFYEGNGRPFKPFCQNRQNTILVNSKEARK